MEDYKEIIRKLSEPLPIEAIQRTRKEETKKQYDTDGYAYQYCIDRFNDVLGLNWGYEGEIIKEMEGQYKSGQKCYDITVKMTIWIINKENKRSCVGGHISAVYTDALKGAITNSFKKTAAFFGVGRDAFAGSLDDDNKPYPQPMSEIKNKPIATEITLEQKETKLKSLPEDIKNFLKERKYTVLSGYEFVANYGFDEGLIRETIKAIKAEEKPEQDKNTVPFDKLTPASYLFGNNEVELHFRRLEDESNR